VTRRIRASVLCAIAILNVGAAVYIFDTTGPRVVAWSSLAFGIMIGVCQTMAGLTQAAAEDSTHPIADLALHLGRWVSLGVGAALLGIVISVCVVSIDSVNVNVRTLLATLALVGYSCLQFLAAHLATSTCLWPPSNSRLHPT
jgi:hypothetical protein